MLVVTRQQESPAFFSELIPSVKFKTTSPRCLRPDKLFVGLGYSSIIKYGERAIKSSEPVITSQIDEWNLIKNEELDKNGTDR